MTMNSLVAAENIAAVIVVVHNCEVTPNIDHNIAGPVGVVGYGSVDTGCAAGKIRGINILDGIISVDHKLVIILDRAVKPLTLVVRLVVDLIIIHAVVVS